MASSTQSTELDLDDGAHAWICMLSFVFPPWPSSRSPPPPMIVGLRFWVVGDCCFLTSEKSRPPTLTPHYLPAVILCYDSNTRELGTRSAQRNNKALCSAHISLWVLTSQWDIWFLHNWTQPGIGVSCERERDRTGDQHQSSLEREVSACTEPTLKDPFSEIRSVNKRPWRRDSGREPGQMTDGLDLSPVSHSQASQRRLTTEITLVAYQLHPDDLWWGSCEYQMS